MPDKITESINQVVSSSLDKHWMPLLLLVIQMGKYQNRWFSMTGECAEDVVYPHTHDILYNTVQVLYR
jgi:hypothetical protein